MGEAGSKRFAIDLAEVRDARQRIARYTVRTPVIGHEQVDSRLGMQVRLKCENLQHIGAFKARGACNAVFSLDADAADRGVVTHSSGNHAAALARAARVRQIPARIVMPRNSSAIKLEAVRGLGVEPELCEPTAEARQAMADQIVADTGSTLVHPYDDPQVMAGQGTVALELIDQLEHFDDLVVPVGGGGLLAGCLVAIKTLRPDVRVYAAEPALADDAYRSLQSGRIESPVRYDTVADGLRTPLGTRTFPVLQSLLDDIFLVTESQILNASSALFLIYKMVAEPSGAVSLAAVLANRQRFEGRRVAVIVSGGNLDPANISSIVDRSPDIDGGA